jgi:hypothetical protein
MAVQLAPSFGCSLAYCSINQASYRIGSVHHFESLHESQGAKFQEKLPQHLIRKAAGDYWDV